VTADLRHVVLRMDLRSQRFADRQDFRALNVAVAEAVTRQGCLMVATGEVGIGKSSLMIAFRAALSGSGVGGL
jgi:hypothetical protein